MCFSKCLLKLTMTSLSWVFLVLTPLWFSLSLSDLASHFRSVCRISHKNISFVSCCHILNLLILKHRLTFLNLQFVLQGNYVAKCFYCTITHISIRIFWNLILLQIKESALTKPFFSEAYVKRLVWFLFSENVAIFRVSTNPTQRK